MPARIIPGSTESYNFLGISMPCPDNYFWKFGQGEVQFYNKQKGELGLLEFIVIWNRLELIYAKNAIVKFNDELANGSWHSFKLLNTINCEWETARGVLVKPTFSDIQGSFIMGFTLHFVRINGENLTISGDTNDDSYFSYGVI